MIFQDLVDKWKMKKLLIFTMLFFLMSCTHWGRMPAGLEAETKHIVFDIDWTISSELGPSYKGVGQRVIEVEGKKYFVHDGLEELIEELMAKKDVKISFFSGGSYLRNHALLKQIKLSDGKTLEEIAYKILNKEDLTVVPGVGNGDKFSKRYKKDLTKISKDLSNLMMIDDTEHFVLDAIQENHVLWTGKTFEHFEHFADSSEATGEYIPRTISEWSFARKKLIILRGAINQAYRQSEMSGISFFEALKIQEQLLNLASGEWNDYSEKMLKNSLDQKVLNASGCFKLITPFLKLDPI